MAAVPVAVYFPSTLQRSDDNGQPYMAFRVEVTTADDADSYALIHLRVRFACGFVRLCMCVWC